MLRCNDGCLFPEKYTVKDHISNTKQVHVQCILLMSLRRPIILLIQIELIQYGRHIGKKVYYTGS